MALKTVQFVAMVLVALSLIPAGAHFFELPNKIGLAQEPYFVVQDIYRGWSLFGIPLIGAIVVLPVLAWLLRRQKLPCWLTIGCFACLAAALAIFFIWTYPANQATQNWTVAPSDWMALRSQWEYAHAVNAMLSFVGFCALALSLQTTRR